MPQPLPKEVSLIRPLEMEVIVGGRYAGKVTLPPGARMKLISVNGNILTVRHGESTATVDVDAMDFWQR